MFCALAADVRVLLPECYKNLDAKAPPKPKPDEPAKVKTAGLEGGEVSVLDEQPDPQEFAWRRFGQHWMQSLFSEGSLWLVNIAGRAGAAGAGDPAILLVCVWWRCTYTVSSRLSAPCCGRTCHLDALATTLDSHTNNVAYSYLHVLLAAAVAGMGPRQRQLLGLPAASNQLSLAATAAASEAVGTAVEQQDDHASTAAPEDVEDAEYALQDR